MVEVDGIGRCGCGHFGVYDMCVLPLSICLVGSMLIKVIFD